MNKIGKIKFNGKSGHRYYFNIYPLETVFDEGLSGVYVVTRRKEGNSKSGFVHKRLSLGHSDDLHQPIADEDQPFAEQGANCICVYAEKDSDARQKIVDDLVREPQTDTV
ncbi:MAG: hypothetical protein HZA50_14995 [Planctomycetes bacterium]|nr:hypothetical protein [Planctomycetota bacterium]